MSSWSRRCSASTWRPASCTSFYLVNLLTGFVRVNRAPSADDEPLGVRLAKALQAAGVRQRDGLRQVGDHSLFISGFFSDSLNRRLVDVDYYIQLGECAYGSLARQGDDTFAEVFDELAARFTRLRGCARGSERADRAQLEFGPLAALRKVGADEEPAQRRPACFARHRSQRLLSAADSSSERC